MLDSKYCEYAKRNGGVRLADLQAEFNLNYREAKQVLDTLVSSGYISYDGGLDYKYIQPAPPANAPHTNIRRYRGPRTRPLFDDIEDTTDHDQKIRDLFDRLRADLEEDDDDEDDDDIDWSFLNDDDDDEDTDENDSDDPIFDVLAEAEKLRLELNRESYENLHAVILKIIEIKSQPVSAFNEPDRSLWQDDDEFNAEVFSRIEKLVQSDRKMGLKGAIKKAETYVEAVRDTHDRKMVQLYENIVYRLKSTTNYQFNLVKKYLFPDEE